MLISLLKYHLFGGEAPTLPNSKETWADLLILSKKHGVTALVYDALEAYFKANPAPKPPRETLVQLATHSSTIESDNKRRELALIHFSKRLFGEKGIKTTVIKGSSLARLYPNPLHRECGDNDIYLGSHAATADHWVMSLEIKVDTKDPRHSSFVFENAEFENHAYLLYPPRVGDTTDEPDWQTTPWPKQEALCRLIPEQEALFLASHLEHHAMFFDEELALGKILDWALLLQSGELDYHAFNLLKKGTAIDRFADLLTQYCVATFAIPAPDGYNPLSQPTFLAFPTLFLSPHPRHKAALVRVWRRGGRYLRYNKEYKEIFGESPFARFYLRNVLQALKQLVTFQHRESRSESLR